MVINVFAIIFVLIDASMLIILPRRWAPLPLLVGACYMTYGQGVEVGPLHFYVIRMLITAGLARVLIRGERIEGKMSGLDWLMLIWASWAVISNAFHHDPEEGLLFRLGLAYDVCGIYFLVRIFCRSFSDLAGLCGAMAIVLLPVAAEMIFEKITGHNLFSALGGVPAISPMREGKIRAQGPFSHSILAGTAGAVCLPFMIAIWRQHRRRAGTGIVACLVMVIASASSGPIMSAAAAIAALFMWHWRQYMRRVRWLAVLGYVGLDLVMKSPPYYLIDRIDLVGGSGGYHRAALIESAIGHLNEWWLAGTDYTRHWMPTGVAWSQNQTDITNYYIKMGVLGGLPLTMLLIAILSRGFSYVGQSQHDAAGLSSKSQFMLWTTGAALFAHAVTCMSVSYFDQSMVFLYFTLAIIGSARSAVMPSGVIDRGDPEDGFSLSSKFRTPDKLLEKSRNTAFGRESF